MTLPLLPSPPLQPTETLTPAQAAFLALHARFVVYQWQWYFRDTMLRAHSVKFSASIWRDELDDLVDRGLMLRGLGVSVSVTEAGREQVAAPEKEATHVHD